MNTRQKIKSIIETEIFKHIATNPDNYTWQEVDLTPRTPADRAKRTKAWNKARKEQAQSYKLI